MKIEILRNNFVISILFFFFVCLIQLLYNYIHIKRNRFLFIRLKHNYEKNIKNSLQNDPNYIKTMLLNDIPEKSIVAERIEALSEIRERGMPIDQISLMENLGAKENARTAFVRYAASIFVLIGLCGAIFGLFEVIGSMEAPINKLQELTKLKNPGDQTGDQTEYKKNSTVAITEAIRSLSESMSNALPKTSSAFAASLSGILATVLILLILWFVSHKHNELLCSIEEFSSIHLVPLFSVPSSSLQLTEVANTFSDNNRFLQNLTRNLVQQSSSFKDNIALQFKSMQEFRNGSQFLKEGQEIIYKDHQSLIGSVNEFISLTHTIKSSQEILQQNLEQVVFTISSMNKLIEHSVKESQIQRESTSEQMQKSMDLVKNVIGSSLDSALNKLGTDALQGLYNKMESHMQLSAEMVEKTLSTQEKFITELVNSAQNFDQHKEFLQSVSTLISSEREEFKSSQERMMQTLCEQLKQMMMVLGNVENGSLKFQKECQELLLLIARKMEAQCEHMDQLLPSLQNMSNESYNAQRVFKIASFSVLIGIPFFLVWFFVTLMQSLSINGSIVASGVIAVMIFGIFLYSKAKGWSS